MCRGQQRNVERLLTQCAQPLFNPLSPLFGEVLIAVAAAVVVFLSSPFYSHHQGSREQLAIAEFANSLLVIPKTLAVNAAQDSADLVAKLRAYHNTSQINTERSSLKWYVTSALSAKCHTGRVSKTLKILTTVYSVINT